MVLADSRRIPPVPRYSGFGPPHFRFTYGALTLCGAPFQATSVPGHGWIMPALQPQGSRDSPGLGWSPFARRYLGNHSCSLLLPLLRCFSSRGSPPFGLLGCPIRTPGDLRPFAPTPGFSQLTASFCASVCLGIHRAPYLAFSLTPAWGARGKAMPNARMQFLFPLASACIAASRASSLRRTSNNSEDAGPTAAQGPREGVVLRPP